MLDAARSLALEVTDLDAALAFYEDELDLGVEARSGDGVELRAGDCTLALRPVGALPRGGAHVHYAFAVPPAEYDDWYERLAAGHDVEERTFGDVRSLYCFDPAGHCVELGERGEGSGITGVFEIVLEVTDLDAATERYTALGFSVVDHGEDRRRVRLTTGELDLELWEPQYGIADARGGDHVEFAITADDPEGIADRLDPTTWRAAVIDHGAAELRDWDGHIVRLVPE